jgi:mycothiol synthase
VSVSGTLRVPTEADVPEILRLRAEDWPEPPSPDSVTRLWTTPGFDRELDARLEEGACGAVVDIGNGSMWLDLCGRPSPALLDWAETRALERSPRVLSGAWSSNQNLLRELGRRGFELIRHSQRMQVDLAEPPPAPDWPDGFGVRTFRPGDERVFYAVQHEAFEDSWEPSNTPFEEWEHWFLGSSPRFAPDLWFLALAGDQPAGVAICHPHPGDPTLGWVGELGVLRPWRRRGLGRALLLQAFAAFRERGLTRAALGVDAESVTGANRLYESAGMHVAARFDIYEKPAA